MSILTHDEAKRLSQSSTDPLEVIRNVEAAMIAKLCAEVERLKEVVNLQVENYAELKEQNEAQHGYFNSVMQERDALQAEAKHLNLHLKATQSGRDAALARFVITEEANSMLLARNKWLEHALEVAGASPVEPSERAEHWHSLYIKKCQELHDEKARLGAEIETLELAAIDDAERYAVPPSQAQPPAPSEAAREYMTGYSDAKEWAGATSQALEAQLAAAQTEVERLNMALHGYQVAIETTEESLKDRVALAMEVERLKAAGAVDCGHRPPCTECSDYAAPIPQPPAPAQAASGAPSESLSDVQRQAFIKGWDHRGMAHELKGSVETDDRMRVLMGVFYPGVDAAPGDTAITYMTGYSDGKEWAGATSQAQPERAPLSDAELEQEFCNITGLETGINPAAADTKRALVWFKKGYAHAIKQGGQHD